MRVHITRRLDDLRRGLVTGLAAAAEHADGVGALSEQTRLNLGLDHPDVQHLLVLADDRDDPAAPPRGADDEGYLIAGYAQLDARPGGEPSAEIVVAPARRRHGIGAALLREVLGIRADARVWAHGDSVAAQALAHGAGLTRTRVLVRMARPLAGGDFAWELPDGYTMHTYTPADAADWVAVNARAFAHHAEQGRMTQDDLAARADEPWFDPAGFFLVRDERGELAAFHWTKVEGGVGEVYVVGVDPGHQGRRLGTAVTNRGLAHLRDLGLPTVELYVDGDNIAALATYERAGFHVADRDVQYAAEMPR